MSVVEGRVDVGRAPESAWCGWPGQLFRAAATAAFGRDAKEGDDVVRSYVAGSRRVEIVL